MDELDHLLKGATRKNRILIDTNQLIPDPNSIFHHTRVVDFCDGNNMRGQDLDLR